MPHGAAERRKIMYIGGLDIGTSGCKITIYDEKGNYIENHYKEYDSVHADGLHEIDAGEIVKAIKQIIGETENIPEALGITSFGETCVLLDKDDNILDNAMLYTDPRADISCFDRNTVMNTAGCPLHGMFSLPKVVWIKKNKPEIYEKCTRILLMEDFVAYILTGNACIDYSLATRTMAFDIRKKEWSHEIFDMAGIEIEKMSKPVPCGTVVGTSDKFGLKGTKIVVCGQDQIASAVGACAFEPGIAVDGSGTVECITPVFESIPDDLSTCEYGFPFIPYFDGNYVCYAFSFTGGASLKWFRDNFAKDEKYSVLDANISDKCSDVLILPHFAGAATPYMDAEAKALIANVTLETSKYDIYKAVMEGVAYEMRINMDALHEFGIVPKKLLATGGGSKSPVWVQIKSDVLGMPITVIDAPEVGTLGAIMITGCAVGTFTDLKAAAEIYIRMGKTYEPNAEKHAQYSEKYETYKKMYKLAKELR